MRVVFMGTPDFAVPTLQKLIEKHDVCAVYCQPDKPKGRGHKLQAPPVKEMAIEHDIPVFQPVTFKDEAVVKQLEELSPEVIVVVAYGKLLPKTVLDIPELGCINVHGSLLPKYRGAAPIQWAVINGDKTTGVTTMFMAEGLDTGDMLLAEETEIAVNETAGELFDKLKDMGADLLIRTLDELESIVPVKQKDKEASYAPMLSKELGKIDWARSAYEINNLIRGLNPWPSAYTELDGKKLKIHSAEIAEFSGNAGEVITAKGEFIVCCGENALILTEIQPENSKRMSAKSYLLGHKIVNMVLK